MPGRTDTASRMIAASPDALYRAFVDPEALMGWLPPGGMSGRALLFEPWPGGRYRIELSYEAGGIGKTSATSDISAGRFLALDPGRRIVQSVAFESGDPQFAGEMIMTWTFAAHGDATLVTITAEHVPSGITAADHAAGLTSSLENLARYAESAPLTDDLARRQHG